MTSMIFDKASPGRPALHDHREVWYWISAVLMASGAFHLGVQLVRGGAWDGPVSWRKPAAFGASFGLTLATITWVSSYVALRPSVRAKVLAVFAFACVLEVGVITLQAWRRVPSHFNVSSPFNATMAYSAAGGGALIVGTSIVLTAAALRQARPDVAPSMTLAVRAGLVTFLVALLIGAAMIAIGVVATRTESQQAAYSAATALKWGHAATMHGVLALPLLAWFVAWRGWPEDRRLRVVRLACWAYVLAAGAVVAYSVVDQITG